MGFLDSTETSTDIGLSPMAAQLAQAQIERQRKIADMLLSQGMQAPDGQMIDGHYVAPSPLQYIARIAQQLVGGMNQRNLDEQQLANADKANRYLANQAQQLYDATTPKPAEPGENLGKMGDDRNALYIEKTGQEAPDVIVGGKPAYNPTTSDLTKAMVKYLINTGNAAKTPDLIMQDARMRMLMAPDTSTTTGASSPSAGSQITNSAVQGSTGQSGTSGNLFGIGSNTAASPAGSVTTGTSRTAGLSATNTPQTIAAPQTNGWGSPAGGMSMQKWLLIDPTGKQYAEQLAKDNAVPDAIKTNRLLGIDNDTARNFEVGKRTKEVMYESQPGSVSTNLVTGEKTFNPKVGEGINMINGVASAVPGYADANASIKGAETAAAENAKAGLDMITVKTPTGPRLMSRADAARYGATGQLPSAASANVQPTAQPSPVPQTGGQVSFQNGVLTPQLMEWMRTNDPESYRAVINGSAAQSQTPAPMPKPATQGNQSPGIQLISPEIEKYQEQLGQAGVKLKEAIDNRVDSGADLNMRLQEAGNALNKFNAGGGAETRFEVAKAAQAIGAPKPLIDRIAGGDFSAMTEFKKLAVQGAMEQLKSAISTGNGAAGRMTQYEFDIFQKNNPNLTTDPDAIRKIFDFNTMLYRRDLAAQKAFADYTAAGNAPSGFPAYWSEQMKKMGFTNPNLTTQNQAGANANLPRITDQAAYNALPSGTVYIGPDGKQRRKQ